MNKFWIRILYRHLRVLKLDYDYDMARKKNKKISKNILEPDSITLREKTKTKHEKQNRKKEICHWKNIIKQKTNLKSLVGYLFFWFLRETKNKAGIIA